MRASKLSEVIKIFSKRFGKLSKSLGKIDRLSRSPEKVVSKRFGKLSKSLEKIGGLPYSAEKIAKTSKTRKGFISFAARSKTPRDEYKALGLKLDRLKRKKARYIKAAKIQDALWKRKKLLFGSGAVAGMLGGGYYGLRGLRKRQEYAEDFKDYAMELQDLKQKEELAKKILSSEKEPPINDPLEDEANDLLEDKIPDVPNMTSDLAAKIDELKDLLSDTNNEPFFTGSPYVNDTYAPVEDEGSEFAYTREALIGVSLIIAIVIYLANKKKKRRKKK